MILDLFAMDDAHDDGVTERDHHHDLDGGDAIEEPSLERSETLGLGHRQVSRSHVAVQHAYRGQTNSAREKHPDNTERAMAFDLAVRQAEIELGFATGWEER